MKTEAKILARKESDQLSRGEILHYKDSLAMVVEGGTVGISKQKAVILHGRGDYLTVGRGVLVRGDLLNMGWARVDTPVQITFS